MNIYSNNVHMAANNAIGVPEQEKHEPEVALQLQLLQKDVEMQREVIAILMDRLFPVTGEVALPPDSDSANKEVRPMVPLASLVSSIRRGVNKNTELLQAATSGLEI